MSFQGTLKVGIPVSLSGQFQVQGKQALAGLQAWANDVNDAGGLALDRMSGLHPVTVVHFDDQSTADGVRRAATRLIVQDRVNLLFGPYSSVLARAATEVAEAHHRVLWNHGGASDDLYQQGYKRVVGVLTPASEYLAGLLPLVREADPGASKIAVVRARPGAFPRAVCSGVERQAGSMGFHLGGVQEFPPTLNDFESILDGLERAQPHVLVVVGRIHNDIQFARQLVKRHLDLRAVVVVAAPIEQFRQALAEDVEGFLGPSQWEPEASYPNDYGPSTQKVLASLARQGQGPVDYPMAQAYAAGLIAQACLERAGSLDDGALRNAASELDISTFYGRFKIDPETGKQVGRSTLLVQWQEGRKVVLWPPGQSQGRLGYPRLGYPSKFGERD